jgi:putative membrane protein
MTLLAAADPIWRWTPHPEVWVLVAGAVALRLYAGRVVAPKALPPGTRAFSTRQTVAFVAAVVCLWVASDWPLHDLAEDRLYSAHMVQHFLLTMVLPPLFWLATPEWLVRLIVPRDGSGWQVLRRVAHPVVALLVFNFVNLLSHWQWMVTTAVENGPFHYTVHVVMVSTAFVMWIPVVGPWRELRLSLPGQMGYLFLTSVIPTLPAMWLANSSTVVYSVYDHDPRLWGISALDDQVIAGIVMKLVEAAYLWAIITGLFFTWASRHLEADRRGIVDVDERSLMTWADSDLDPPTARASQPASSSTAPS